MCELDRRCQRFGWTKIDLEPGEKIGCCRTHRARACEHVEHPRVDRLPFGVVTLEHAIPVLWRQVDGGICQVQRFGDKLPDQSRVICARLFRKRVSEQSEAEIAVKEPCICRFPQASPPQEEVEIARAFETRRTSSMAAPSPASSIPLRRVAAPRLRDLRGRPDVSAASTRALPARRGRRPRARHWPCEARARLVRRAGAVRRRHSRQRTRDGRLVRWSGRRRFPLRPARPHWDPRHRRVRACGSRSHRSSRDARTRPGSAPPAPASGAASARSASGEARRDRTPRG